MTLETALAVAASLLALAFSMSTFERWLDRRRHHELAWTAALGLFCLAAAALAAGGTAGWSPGLFRTFYLLAFVNVPVLALGTVYLLGGERRGTRFAVVVAVATAFAAGVLVSAPATAPAAGHELPQGSDVFGALPRVLAAGYSTAGALVVFGGAVWSVARRRLVVPNFLIASGTAVLSVSGVLNSVLGAMTAFSLTLVLGVTLLFAGFLLATPATPLPGPPAIRPSNRGPGPGYRDQSGAGAIPSE